MRPRTETAEYQLLLTALRKGEQHSFHSAAELLQINPKNARFYITLAKKTEGVYVARWGRGTAGPAYPILAWSMFDRDDAAKPNRKLRQRVNRQRRDAARQGLKGLIRQLVRPSA